MRTHVPTIFVVCMMTNIGMWVERYVIIITGLSREFNPAVWGHYTPAWPELIILAGSFCFFQATSLRQKVGTARTMKRGRNAEHPRS